MKIKIIIILLTLFSLSVTAIAFADSHGKKPAATSAEKDKIIKPSGFLGNYENFKVINPETSAKVWIKPPHEDLSLLKDYKAIVFSPIEVWMDPSEGYQGIDPNELKLITDYFLEQLQNNLGKNFEIVENSGPKVMNLRIAITGVKKSRPKREVYDLIPIKLAWELGSAAYRGVAGKHLDAYSATAEMEIRDTQTGERLVAAIDTHSVNRTTDKGEDTWEPLQKVIDYWAKVIGKRLAAAKA